MVSDFGDLDPGIGEFQPLIEGGLAPRPASPPRGLEFPAIARAAWRFDTLTQRCRLVPLPGTGGKAPHRSSVARAARAP
jgi:hypothetical protein